MGIKAITNYIQSYLNGTHTYNHFMSRKLTLHNIMMNTDIISHTVEPVYYGHLGTSYKCPDY